MGNIHEFIKARKRLGHITVARFNASYSAPGMKDFEFSLASLNPPSIRANTGQLYFDAMPVEVFTTFQYDMDFSMNIICDNAGTIYSKFISLLKSGKNDLDAAAMPASGYSGNFNFNKIIDPETSITIQALSDKGDGYGMKTILYGIRIKSVGAIDYSNNSNEIAFFSVNASAIDFMVVPRSSSGSSAFGYGANRTPTTSRNDAKNRNGNQEQNTLPPRNNIPIQRTVNPTNETTVRQNPSKPESSNNETTLKKTQNDENGYVDDNINNSTKLIENEQQETQEVEE